MVIITTYYISSCIYYSNRVHPWASLSSSFFFYLTLPTDSFLGVLYLLLIFQFHPVPYLEPSSQLPIYKVTRPLVPCIWPNYTISPIWFFPEVRWFPFLSYLMGVWVVWGCYKLPRYIYIYIFSKYIYIHIYVYGCFQKKGVPPNSQNGWFIMEHLLKMDDLGVPLSLETPIKGTGRWGFTKTPAHRIDIAHLQAPSSAVRIDRIVIAEKNPSISVATESHYNRGHYITNPNNAVL